MAYTLPGGFVLGSLFNYISASAFVFAGHFGLSASQFSYLFAGNSVALVLGGAISNWLLGQGRQAGGIMLTGIGAHARAGRQCAVPQIRPHEIHPWPGLRGQGARRQDGRRSPRAGRSQVWHAYGCAFRRVR